MAATDSPVRRFFGYAAMTLGVLLAFLSGACSLVVLSTSSAAELGSMAVAVLLLGGIPFVVGLALFFLGRWLVRTSRADADTVF